MITIAVMSSELVAWTSLGAGVGVTASMPIGSVTYVLATTACERERESRMVALTVVRLDSSYAHAALSTIFSKPLPLFVREGVARVLVRGYGVPRCASRALSSRHVVNPICAVFRLSAALALRENVLLPCLSDKTILLYAGRRSVVRHPSQDPSGSRASAIPRSSHSLWGAYMKRM
jgi:hypothetical protein